MFTASEFRRIARDKLRGHWGRSVLVTFIVSLICGISIIYDIAKNMGYMVFGMLSGMLSAGNYNDFFAGFSAADTVTILFGLLIVFVLNIVALLPVSFMFISFMTIGISGALEMGLNKYYIDLVAENRQGEVSVIFSRFDIFFKALGLHLFMALFKLLWTLLFIVPGIIAGYRYCLAPYLMAENPNLGIREAVNMSKELMAGHKWRLFCLNLSFIGWGILSSLTCGIGDLWLNPYIYAANAAFYVDLIGRDIPMAGEPNPDPAV
ncbi:MAG: DUF975 family protein [Clostridiales bacterium]|nr:DUF975 family protein [Clostridiales bacterium]